MPKRSRIRRLLKWAGLVVCVLLAFTIIVSRWWNIVWINGHYWGFVQWGGAAFGHRNRVDAFRWDVERNIVSGPLWWWFDYQPGTQTRSSCFIAPLWLPLAVIGLAVILAWRRDRRPPASHCRTCGYDLTGNVSGRCPECGQPI